MKPPWPCVDVVLGIVSGPNLNPLDPFEANVSRPANDSLLDSVFGPMVHDAMMSQQWRDRWQAHIYISSWLALIGGFAWRMFHQKIMGCGSKLWLLTSKLIPND